LRLTARFSRGTPSGAGGGVRRRAADKLAAGGLSCAPLAGAGSVRRPTDPMTSPPTTEPPPGRASDGEPEDPERRLERQFAFVREIDRLKGVLRRTTLHDGSRKENSAEHSWHLATMALVLAEYAPNDADVLRAVQLCLVHDVVEIDAGDTFAYDAAANVDKAAREQAAATRVFGLLPLDQAIALRALWEEFEQNETPTARFANALDRLQ